MQKSIYVLFSFCFTFFLICSYIFGFKEGFQTVSHFLFVLLTTLLLTPLVSIGFIRLSHFQKNCSKYHDSRLSILCEHRLFYVITIFILQLPVFLAFYPGMCYYDLSVQIEQYEIPYFVLNHPLLHTLFMGFFKNLFLEPNTGYAFATLIQMLIVDSSMAYALQYIHHKKHCTRLCTFLLLFYALFPVNSVLTISTTKDTLFSAFALIFFIDIMRFFNNELKTRGSLTRFIVNTVLMLTFRNNVIYAFIPACILIVIIRFIKKEKNQHVIAYTIISLCLYFIANHALVNSLQAVPGSIKEMMSIPSQQLAYIYSITDDDSVKEIIHRYIPEPEKYCYYLSDPIKQQLDFDTLDSACKHFLLDTAICDLKYPIAAFDAAFYNTQGYWDLFHSPYQSEHFFLTSGSYRGDAVLDSKLPALAEFYINAFHTTKEYQRYPFVIVFFNSALYIWFFLFCFLKIIHEKDSHLSFNYLFFLFYLMTLLLGPGAITRYAYPYILLSPILLSTFYMDTTLPETHKCTPKIF